MAYHPAENVYTEDDFLATLAEIGIGTDDLVPWGETYEHEEYTPSEEGPDHGYYKTIWIFRPGWADFWEIRTHSSFSPCY